MEPSTRTHYHLDTETTTNYRFGERMPHSVTTDTIYAWRIDALIATGSLSEYAHDIESAHYAGLTMGRLYRLIPSAGDPLELALVSASCSTDTYEANDYANTTITDEVTGDVASYRIDLRA